MYNNNKRLQYCIMITYTFKKNDELHEHHHITVIIIIQNEKKNQ